METPREVLETLKKIFTPQTPFFPQDSTEKGRALFIHSFSPLIPQNMWKDSSLFGVDVGGDGLDHLGKGGIGAHLLLHLIQRVQHRGMVAAAELLADVHL